jgi:hypothetical protein
MPAEMMGTKAPHPAKEFLFWSITSISGTKLECRSLFISDSPVN